MSKTFDNKWSWVYLFNLIFYLIPLWAIELPWWQRAIALLVLIPFLFCYFWGYRAAPQQLWQPTLCIYLLAVAISPLNPGSIALFTFAGYFIGMGYPAKRAIFTLLGVCASILLLNELIGYKGPYFFVYGSVLVLGVGGFGMLDRHRRQLQHQEAQSREEIAQLAQMVERERIARDLHDIMGHSLSSIALKADLALALSKAGQTDAAQQQLTELAQIARESLSQVRQTVSGYKHKGLLGEITTLAQRLRDGGFQVSLEGEVPKLAARAESAIILVLTELCTNVLRHSKGDVCRISFADEGTHWRIEVSDNGLVQHLGAGNGLTGVRERLQPLSAHLELDAGAGLTARIRLPKHEATATVASAVQGTAE
ncbi:MAG TPA: sensor histidine kinase [Rheinheimera sp.]|nr:sensor histidine kinase [Rheinheimera sp.]